MDPTWQATTHDGLTARQMHDLIRLRHQVFVREQACPEYDDIDGLDTADDTWHLLAEQGGRLAAYARVLAPSPGRPESRVGRVVVADGARGTGLGRALVREAVALCDRTWPGTGIALSAQAHLVDLYAAFGFTAVGQTYLDDGIPHVDMTRPPA